MLLACRVFLISWAVKSVSFIWCKSSAGNQVTLQKHLTKLLSETFDKFFFFHHVVCVFEIRTKGLALPIDLVSYLLTVTYSQNSARRCDGTFCIVDVIYRECFIF